MHFIDANGRHRSTGTKDLKSTQAYPIGFGLFHAMQFDQHIRSIGAVTFGPEPDPGSTASPPVDDMGCFTDLDTNTADFWYNNLKQERTVALTMK